MPVQEISCVLCRDSDSEPVIQENGFTGRQCSHCGLIFISPRPSRDEIEEIYEHGEAHLSPEDFIAGPESLAGKVRAKRDVRRLRRHAKGGRLLEIGPGRGTFLAAAQRRGFGVYGVELNPAQAKFIRNERGIPCVESLDDAQTLGPDAFDVIYYRDVLSHFYDPHEEFARLHGLLKPGGLHVFETGNFGDMDHKYFRLIKSFQYPDHLFMYGERSLGLLLDQTGFEHVRTYRYSILPEQYVHSKVRRLIGSGLANSGERSGGVAQASTSSPRRGVRESARQLLDLFYDGLQRTAGAIPARAAVPKTLIVVARKAERR